MWNAFIFPVCLTWGPLHKSMRGPHLQAKQSPGTSKILWKTKFLKTTALLAFDYNPIDITAADQPPPPPPLQMINTQA